MNELIKALRNCATKIRNCGDGCAYKDKGSLYCQSHLQLDAADAIEQLLKERDELQEQVYLLKPNREIAMIQEAMLASMLAEIEQIKQRKDEIEHDN